ncbi:ribonuclease E inhibitor RraB [Zhongshania aquimaris]|uniref:Ribonuclease E inhibitor RraB n=1 Tax=Zhongshania aquimaris TaxID=2857107 RepID=A0ABS6VVV0_9GAMM|nr:ribonuclease E inhibitor RraB [Zhongshania aquimaris]MBW2942467.1 ribonuclease E inhibitor RraB [Zhongshania aquimaris]
MYPNDVNGDVFRRLEEDNFDFSIEHPVDFYAIYATEEEADLVAKQYATDWKRGQQFKNIETRPSEKGGMELELVPIMKVTYENIVAFEKTLAERTAKVNGYLDGWGVLNG